MAEAKPRVSIGLPVFNGEDYLAEALDSILAQTYTDFELIISDNASTDRTREICHSYAAQDKRIRYFRSEANLGAARNYNRVFELSSGEYFKWAAHDDVCAPEFLERCVKVLDREPDVVLCYPKTNIIDEHGELVEHYVDDFDLRAPKSHERFRHILRTGQWLNPVCGVIRADVLRGTQLIGKYAVSDRVLLAELALVGRFYEVPEYLFYRRIHPQKSTQANTTDEEIAAWFDPATRGRVLAPRWKRFLGHLRSIRRAPLSWDGRMRCYIEVGSHYLAPRRLKGVVADLRQAGRLVSRFFPWHRQEARNAAGKSSVR
jgi:glycosyltransferase involved in cell wall biosynthesis